mmetsp:Transcript_34037/g.113581  ORF Transcript_34037/g.113581 Transcript_34037/m.113581 type:complete len:289 (+) Transcript_34037:1092-1958(+)
MAGLRGGAPGDAVEADGALAALAGLGQVAQAGVCAVGARLGHDGALLAKAPRVARERLDGGVEGALRPRGALPRAHSVRLIRDLRRPTDAGRAGVGEVALDGRRGQLVQILAQAGRVGLPVAVLDKRSSSAGLTVARHGWRADVALAIVWQDGALVAVLLALAVAVRACAPVGLAEDDAPGVGQPVARGAGELVLDNRVVDVDGAALLPSNAPLEHRPVRHCDVARRVQQAAALGSRAGGERAVGQPDGTVAAVAAHEDGPAILRLAPLDRGVPHAHLRGPEEEGAAV